MEGIRILKQNIHPCLMFSFFVDFSIVKSVPRSDSTFLFRYIRFWNTLTGQPMQSIDTGSQVGRHLVTFLVLWKLITLMFSGLQPGLV